MLELRLFWFTMVFVACQISSMPRSTNFVISLNPGKTASVSGASFVARSSSRLRHCKFPTLRLAGGDNSDDEGDSFEKVTNLGPPPGAASETLKPRKKRALADLKNSRLHAEPSKLADLFASSDTESGSMQLSSLANETLELTEAVGGVHMSEGSESDFLREAKLQGPEDMIDGVGTTASNSSAGHLVAGGVAVGLRGHPDATLDNFRMERIAFDKQGQPLPKHTYRWRDTIVEVEMGADGRKQRLVDVVRKEVVHQYAERTPVQLKGHAGVTLEDFALERIPTKTMGVFRWRDRDVRVVVGDRGEVDRIIDTDDGSNVFIFDEEDAETSLLRDDMLDPQLFRMDRQAASLRLARMVDESTLVGGTPGPPFGPAEVVWPKETDGWNGEIVHEATMIWLHGMGASAELTMQVADKLEANWCKYIFLGAPMQPVTLMNGSVTTSWFDVHSIDEKSVREDEVGLQRSTEFLCSIIQDEIERGIPPGKILLCGIGQGAAVVLNAALRTFRYIEKADDEDSAEEDDEGTEVKRLPWDEELGNELMGKVGGVACFAGWMPKSVRSLDPAWKDELSPTFWKGKKVGKRGGVELFVGHGKQDEVIPYKLGRRLFKSAQTMGFAAAAMHKYEMGHGICNRELIDFQMFLDRIAPSPILSIYQKMGRPEVPITADELREDDTPLLELDKKPSLPTDAGALARLRLLQKG